MPDGLLRYVEVAIGDGGLPGCTRCEEEKPLSPRSSAQVVADLRVAAAEWDGEACGPGPNIALAGGEPFAHPELPAIVFAATEAHVERLRLRTGAEALSVAENAAGVLHAGVRHLEVVVLADAAAHDELTARPGAFAAAASGVSAFATAARDRVVPVAVAGRVPVCRHNLAHVPAAVAALSRLGARDVVLDVSREAALSLQAGEWIASACQTGLMNGTWVSVATPEPLSEVPALHHVALWSPADIVRSGGKA